MTYTVGELARRTGLTTRTLHHYETLGLLRPAQRTPAGYRLYDDTNLAQLHAVLAYRYLGLPLKDIAELLADRPPPLRELLQRQAALVQERIARHERLLLALRSCTRAIDGGSSAIDAELLGLITATRLCEESLSPEEHQVIAETRASLSESEAIALQADASALTQALDTHRLNGDAPDCDAVLALARRLGVLRERIAGTDAAFHDKIRHIAAQTPALLRARGVTPELVDYARLAREALERRAAAIAGEAPKKAPKTGRRGVGKAA